MALVVRTLISAAVLVLAGGTIAARASVSRFVPQAAPETPTQAGVRQDVLRLRPTQSGLTGEVARLASDGWDRYSAGDLEGARRALADAVAQGADESWVYYLLGLSELGLGQPDAAASAWEFVRRQLPDYEPVYFHLADAYLAGGRRRDAIVVLRAAAAIWSDRPKAHNALGVALFGGGDFDRAIASFERAIQLAPQDGLGYFNIARAYHGRMYRWGTWRVNIPRDGLDPRADRDRLLAIQAYERALELGGGSTEVAREALRALDRIG